MNERHKQYGFSSFLAEMVMGLAWGPFLVPRVLRDAALTAFDEWRFFFRRTLKGHAPWLGLLAPGPEAVRVRSGIIGAMWDWVAAVAGLLGLAVALAAYPAAHQGCIRAIIACVLGGALFGPFAILSARTSLINWSTPEDAEPVGTRVSMWFGYLWGLAFWACILRWSLGPMAC